MKKTLPFNRNVDSLIAQALWLIDRPWALTQKAKYLEDVLIAETHGLKALKYKERIQAQKGKVMVGGAQVPLSDFQAATDQSGVAVLQLDGVMQVEDGLSSKGIRSLVEEIRLADDTPGILGTVLEVNSGGGDVIASGMLKSALGATKKPVVVLAHFMASGALYGTLPAKNVLASDQFSYIGSIGAMYSLDKEMATWYKENVDDIYATSSSEKREEWRAYLEGDKSVYEKSAETFAQAFMTEVTKARGLNEQQQKVALKGRMFTAQQALELNLITGIGSLQTAVELVQSNAQALVQRSPHSNNAPIMYKTIVQQLNRLFSLNLSDDATAEQLTEALSKLEGLEGITAKVTGLESKLAALDALPASVQDLITRFDQVPNTESVTKSVADALAPVSTQVTSLVQQVQTLTTDLKTVSDTVAGKALEEGKETVGETIPAPGKNLQAFNETYEKAVASNPSKY